MTIPADAQFSLVRTLRPPPDYETVYDGSGGAIPFPGRVDESAGKAGFDPNLLAGLPVPLGSRILLWLPMITSTADPVQTEPDQGYIYKIVFRLRNPRDFRNPGQGGVRQPYHFPKQSPGVPDTTVLANQARFVIPACAWVVAYQQSETFSANGPFAQIRMYPEGIMPNQQQTGVATSPADPTAVAVVQQGVFDPAVVPASKSTAQPAWLPLFLDACGDDMLILFQKVLRGVTVDNWDFSGDDAAVPAFYSNDEVGIFVLTGMMP